MTTALKSLLIGAAVAVGCAIPVTFAYLMWMLFVSPGAARQGGGEVGIDVITLARNTLSFWIIEGLIFIAASVLLYRYFSRHRPAASSNFRLPHISVCLCPSVDF